jgi:hypothetical protein
VAARPQRARRGRLRCGQPGRPAGGVRRDRLPPRFRAARRPGVLHHRRPALVERLQAARVNIAGQDHAAYQWISIHSGHGGGAEADHFEWATQGARLAYRFVPEALHPTLTAHLYRGFADFARDHLLFFQRVNDAT